jgi:hypothetical protein
MSQVSVRNPIKILDQDVFLGKGVLQPDCKPGFDELGEEGPRPASQVPHDLLGDRGGAGDDPAVPEVLKERPDDRRNIYPFVEEKIPVLRNQRRPDEVGGYLPEPDPPAPAPLIRKDLPEKNAVAVRDAKGEDGPGIELRLRERKK